jgi:hypothetical protein
MQPDVGSDQVHLLVVIQPKIDYTLLAEGGYRDTRLRIQRNQPVAGRDIENSFFRAVGPVGQTMARKASRSSSAARAFVLRMHPQKLASCSIQRDHCSP